MNQPIDWKFKVKIACREAAVKGLKLERLGGGGWFVWLPTPEETPLFQRPKVRITSAPKLIEFVEKFQSCPIATISVD